MLLSDTLLLSCLLAVSNGKIGYHSRPVQGQFIEDFHSQISSGRATERALLQQGIMGLVGSPLHNEYVISDTAVLNSTYT